MGLNILNKVRCSLLETFNGEKPCVNCSTIRRRTQYEEVPDNYELPYNNHSHNQQQQQPNDANSNDTVMIKIDVPLPLREEPRFPKEKWKTFISFILLSINFMFATISLSLVHDRLPNRDIYSPLPDIVLDNTQSYDWALDVSEVLIVIMVNSCVVLITFHKHRFIVMRRVFLIMSLLYLMRSITMYVTVLPISSTTYYCSPKSNHTTTLMIMKRAFYLLSGFGLSINGKHTYCGDYIYSGHTVMLVLGSLIISEYSPRRFWLLHCLSYLVALVGVAMVLMAHGHYTIDVIIAYYVTTRLFWTYHTLANNNYLLKQSGSNNFLGREWWYPFFKYFERNIRTPIPRQYEWPLPWPRRFHSKLPCRES